MPKNPESLDAVAWAKRLSLAGFMANAIAFGPARMGFGLFLPMFRGAFDLSTTQAGLIASGGFLAFLVALPLTAWLALRVGQRAPVLAGAWAAVAGFALIAQAADPATLAVGVALAGTSAGFCWAPFNDATERVVPSDRQPGTLSAVATGTTVGVAAAGALALAVSTDALGWRAVWGAFAMIAVVAALVASIGMPAGRGRLDPGGATGAGLVRQVLRSRLVPLYVIALIFGATNGMYLSFAADRVVAAGALTGIAERAGASVVFLAYGVFGILGLATGMMEVRLGLARLIALIFSAFAGSLALIAVLPGSLSGVVTSAGLHGAAVMMISAVLSLWTLRLFPGRGSLGLTVALISVAAGSVLGTVLAGALITAVGPAVAFVMFALPSVAVAAAVLARPRVATR